MAGTRSKDVYALYQRYLLLSLYPDLDNFAGLILVTSMLSRLLELDTCTLLPIPDGILCHMSCGSLFDIQPYHSPLR